MRPINWSEEGYHSSLRGLFKFLASEFWRAFAMPGVAGAPRVTISLVKGSETAVMSGMVG